MIQLPLNVYLHDELTFENFISGENKHVINALKLFLTQQDATLFYVWSSSVSGKTHLLQALCHEAIHHKISVMYLPLIDMIQLPIAVLDDLEQYDLIVLDDLEKIAHHPEWEEAIFHLYNKLMANGHRLCVSAHCAPHEIPCDLPDLKSRLNAGVTFKLADLTESEVLNALVLRAKCRGLVLPDNVGEFLLTHCTRDLRSLFDSLDTLDKVSLAEQRKLTIPFVKEVLKI